MKDWTFRKTLATIAILAAIAFCARGCLDVLPSWQNAIGFIFALYMAGRALHEEAPEAADDGELGDVKMRLEALSNDISNIRSAMALKR